jgi:hypothetical protein
MENLDGLLVDGEVVVSDKTPLLKFLLWNAPNNLLSIAVDDAKSLYFAYERYSDLVKPTEQESLLIKRILYGV